MTPLAEIFLVFLRLGLTSFGGPVAHLGYFREAFVVRRKWIDEAAYADLVALCQFLPGPASSQVGFALGLKRGGAMGGLAAWLGFTAPSAVLMLAVAYGVDWFATSWGRAIAHGLKLVAVAVVAHAVVGMARGLLNTPLRWGCAVTTAVALVLAPTQLIAPGFIVMAGAIGALRWDRPEKPWDAPPHGKIISEMRIWVLAVLALLALCVFAFVGTDQLEERLAQIAAVMARAGFFVFGGGHAVLPLLQEEVVSRGWLTTDEFLMGYGAAQAVPGPLFSFAAYVGGASGAGVSGALVALLAIFAPGIALVSLALPWWEKLKTWRRAVGFVAGAGAAVVGVLAAALYNPVFTSAVRGWPDVAIAAAGFALLQWMKAPAWMVVLIVTVAGAGSVLAASGAPVH